MNCCVNECKGKSYIVFPTNELIDTHQPFCFSHYKSLRRCTNVDMIKKFYKKYAILDNTKSSKGDDSKNVFADAITFSRSI